MASRSAIACSSTVPVASIWPSAADGQVDGGVERERRELLALGVGNGLRLSLGELAQAAQEILGIATERKPEAAASFHAAQRSSTLWRRLDLGHEALDRDRALLHRLREARGRPAARDRVEIRGRGDPRLDVVRRVRAARRPARTERRSTLRLAGGSDPRRLSVRAQSEPASLLPGRERAEVDAHALARARPGITAASSSPSAAWARARLRDRLELVVEIHGVSLDSARGRDERAAAACDRALRAARPDVRPLRATALVRTGRALAPVPRRSRGRRARRSRARRRHRHGRGRHRARAAQGMPRDGPRSERGMLAGRARASATRDRARRRRRRPPPLRRTARSTGSRSRISFATSTTPRATLAELARVVRPGGTVAGLEFAVPENPLARAAWKAYVGWGLPLAGRLISPGWAEVGGFLSAQRHGLLARVAPRSPARSLASGRHRRRRSPPPQLRGRHRHLGSARVTRASWYALRTGGWRDYVTLLHVPYTALASELRRHRRGDRPGLASGQARLDARRLRARARHRRARARRAPRPAARDPHPRRASSGGSPPSRSRWPSGSGSQPRSRGGRGSRAFVAFGGFIVVAYNLELFGGAFHSDLWFAVAWGSFPLLTAYAAAAETVTRAAVAAAVFAALLSLAQRRLSTPVRMVRRRARNDLRARSSSTTASGCRSRPELLLRGPEQALRALTAATIVLAVALVLLRV